MSPDKNNKHVPEKPSGARKQGSIRVANQISESMVVVNPFKSGKRRLIAGFLLSGVPCRHVLEAIKGLVLDKGYDYPVETSCIVEIISRLKKQGLLNSEGARNKFTLKEASLICM